MGDRRLRGRAAANGERGSGATTRRAANVARLLRREHAALGEFLVALADIDRKKVWEQLGHASLFSFLVRELHLSKAAAQYRKVAAELIQEIPGVVEPLRDGRLCLSSIIEAAKVVTAECAGRPR